MRDELYYKSLRADGCGQYSGVTWPLDGSWIEAAGELDPCRNGIHVCRRSDIVHWINGRIFVVECDGARIECSNKIVFQRARVVSEFDTWNEVTQRLFAADCAESVLHLFEAQHPNDKRPRLAIEAARAFARGEIRDAARAAARAASWAAGAAALDAAWAAWAAALAAARDAVSAARAAALDAASGAEEDVQTELLFDYLEGRRV